MSLSSFLTSARETLTAIIAISIVVVSLKMLNGVFDTATTANTAETIASFGRQKEVLGFSLGLLGTVMGYYFGRVPAERAADRAQITADDARASEQNSRQKVAAGLDQISRALEDTALRDPAEKEAQVKEAILALRRQVSI